MANDSFNVSVKDVDTGGSFLTSSRGATPVEPLAAVKTSGGLGEALSGIGDLFKQVTSGIDQTIKQDVQDKLYRQTDQVFNEVGVGDVGVANSSPDTPPKALVGAFDNLQRVKDAMDSGAISKTNFDGRLVSVAQQLRYQYQGHREYIDDMMHKITGVRPQHQVFMDLMEESNKRTSQAQKEETQWNAALQHYLPFLPPDMVKSPQEARRNLPTPAAMAIAAKPVMDARQKLSDSEKILDVNAKVQSADEGQSKRLIASNMNSRFDLALAGASQLFGGIEGINKLAAEMAANPNSDTAKTLISGFANWKTQIINQMSEAARNRIAEYKLPASTFGEIMAPHLEYMKTIEDGLSKGDMSVLKMMATRNQAIKDGDDAYALGNQDIRALAMVNRNIGPEGVKIFQAQVPQLQGPVAMNKMYTNMTKFFANPRNTIIDATDPINQHSPEERQAILNTVQEIIKSLTTDPNFKSKAVNILYAPKNEGLMARVSESDRRALWAKMTDPQLVSEMKKGSGMNYQVYQEWVQNEFRNQFRGDMTELLKRERSAGAAAISFDERTNRFVITPPEQGRPTGTLAEQEARKLNPIIARNIVRQQDVYTVDAVNAGLTALEPILKDKGISVQDYLKGSYGAYALPGMAPKPTTGDGTQTPISKLGAVVGDQSPTRPMDLSVATQGAADALTMRVEDRQLVNAQSRQLSPAQGIDMEIQELVKLYMDKPDADVLANINDLVKQLSKARDEVPAVRRTEPAQRTLGDTTTASKSSLKDNK